MSALDDAIEYIDSQFGPTYRAWEALSAEDQLRTLVTSGRFLDLLAWQGTATGVIDGDSTLLQWPRSGVTVGGVAVSSLTIPDDIVAASFELAVLIASDPAILGKADQGSNISSVSAGGGVGVTFFNATSARSGTATMLPVIVQRLVGRYLALPSGSLEGGDSVGGNCSSSFGAEDRFTLGSAG